MAPTGRPEVAETNRAAQRRREVDAGRVQEEELTRVQDRGEVDGRRRVTLEWRGGGVGVPLPHDHGLEPGDRVRLYSTGPGSIVRGVDAWDGDGWRPVSFRTDAELERQRADERWRTEEEKAVEFAEKRPDMLERIDALPGPFRRRFTRFRRNEPRFLIEFGEYELSACEEAAAMAEWARGRADAGDEPSADHALERLALSDHDAAREMYDPVHDGHSGNSWHVAVKLARAYVSRPEVVELMHGAMARLVGCEDYGCPPPSEEDWREEAPEL